MSIMPVFFCRDSGTETRGGRAGPGPGRQGTEGRREVAGFGVGVRKGRGTEEEEEEM